MRTDGLSIPFSETAILFGVSKRTMFNKTSDHLFSAKRLTGICPLHPTLGML
jgi:hypothetical protein